MFRKCYDPASGRTPVNRRDRLLVSNSSFAGGFGFRFLSRHLLSSPWSLVIFEILSVQRIGIWETASSFASSSSPPPPRNMPRPVFRPWSPLQVFWNSRIVPRSGCNPNPQPPTWRARVSLFVRHLAWNLSGAAGRVDDRLERTDQSFFRRYVLCVACKPLVY